MSTGHNRTILVTKLIKAAYLATSASNRLCHNTFHSTIDASRVFKLFLGHIPLNVSLARSKGQIIRETPRADTRRRAHMQRQITTILSRNDKRFPLASYIQKFVSRYETSNMTTRDNPTYTAPLDFTQPCKGPT